MQEHWQKQKAYHDEYFANQGTRSHVTSQDPLVRDVVRWRLEETVRRLVRASAGRITKENSVLVLCSGEGLEGTVLADLGFADVTVSDLSEHAVNAAVARDNRLKGRVINAERSDVSAGTYDVVIVQDGLHHLASPVHGFLEMLRICRVGCAFLEPHDSLPGRLLGSRWERNGDAINYVFRWDSRLVEKVTSSFFASEHFTNVSFSYWHHNNSYAKIGKIITRPKLAILAVRIIRTTLGIVLPGWGNQFSGVILKNPEHSWPT
jgi:SAM-dependent methyltransferase